MQIDALKTINAENAESAEMIGSAGSAYSALPRSESHHVDVVTSADAFAQLGRVWNDLVERSGVAHPFLSHEWVGSWWDAFGTKRQLFVLVVKQGGQAIAIAPLMADTTRMCGVPVRRLALLQNDHSPRADFIVGEERQGALRAIWHTLAEQRDRWDVLQLSQLPEESDTLKTLEQLAGADGCASGVWKSGASPYLTITGTSSEFFQRLTPKFRQNIRNRRSRLDRLGDAKLEVITGGPALTEGLADMVRLEASGWKRDAGTAISSDATVYRFYETVAPRLAERGSLRLLFLTVGGRRIATSFSVCESGRLFLCKTGYDPEFETCSPFKVLMSLVVEYACDQALAEVDLLGDPEPWKLEWTKSTRAHNWLFVFSNTPRAKVLYPLKFRVLPALKQSAVAQLVRG